jgi:hypothetical protein
MKMPIWFFQENISRFIGELSSRQSGVGINWDGRMDPGITVPSISSREFRQEYLHGSRNAGKGVDTQSTVLEIDDEFQAIFPNRKQNVQ